MFIHDFLPGIEVLAFFVFCVFMDSSYFSGKYDLMNIPRSIVFVVMILLVAAVSVLFVLHFSAREQYVFVDSVKLVNGYEAMKDARKDYEQKVAAWCANLDTLRVEAETQIKE